MRKAVLGYAVVVTMPQPVWKRKTTFPSMPFNSRFRLTGMPHPGQVPIPGAIRFGMAVASLMSPPFTIIFPVSGSKVQAVTPGDWRSFVSGAKYCGCGFPVLPGVIP